MDKMKHKETNEQSKLDDDTISYFKRVESVIEDDDFEDEEAKKLFVENVFIQVEGSEILLACDQTMSRVLERFLQHLNPTQLKKVWGNLSNDFKGITRDRYGSHVMQTLVNLVPKTIRVERTKVKEVELKEEEPTSMEELFLAYCSFVHEDLNKLIENSYATHIVRAVFEVLAGVHVADNVQRSRNSRGCRGKIFKMEEKKFVRVKPVGQAFGSTEVVNKSQTIAVPESFVCMLEQLALRIIDMDLKKHVFNRLSCPVLQTLLLALHQKHPKLCSKLCKKIMSQVKFGETEKRSEKIEENGQQNNKERIEDDGKEKYQVPSLFSHDVGSHLVEKILHVISPKVYKKLYKNFFKGHLQNLALHHVANYLVQHLLASTPQSTLGEEMLDELLDEVEELLSAGHDGVVTRMAELSVRLEVRQKELKKSMLKAFHCTERKEKRYCSRLILSMTTYDILFGENGKETKQADENNDEKTLEKAEVERVLPKMTHINFHGAVLLKTLLELQEPKVFVDSLLYMSKEELMRMCQDPMGSRTAEAFFKSRTVKNKKKNMFCDKMKGEFATLSCDKQASHVVETCWSHVDTSQKEVLLQELLHEEHKLAKDFFGSKVIKKCCLEQFKKKQSDWAERAEKAKKRRKYFDEIIHEDEKKKRKLKGLKEAKQGDNIKIQKYASEMAILGYDTVKSHEEDINERKAVTKTAKVQTGKRQKTEDDIDIIFRNKKSLKENTTATSDSEAKHT